MLSDVAAESAQTAYRLSIPTVVCAVWSIEDPVHWTAGVLLPRYPLPELKTEAPLKVHEHKARVHLDIPLSGRIISAEQGKHATKSDLVHFMSVQLIATVIRLQLSAFAKGVEPPCHQWPLRTSPPSRWLCRRK